MFNKRLNGFTLVELMVVILIIAILLAVAIPVFLGSRDRAVVRVAQQRLGDVVKICKELAGGGAGTTVSGAESGIDYGDQTVAQINAEIDDITVVDTSAVALDCSTNGADVGFDPTPDANGSGTIDLTTCDANGDVQAAAIAANGDITYP